MKDEYDFSGMKSRKNPYAKKLKKQITIRLAVETIDYFKTLAEESGLPYQNLIDLYLEDCARHHKKMEVTWS
jgi:predicted DNA binding CopG/RHH family protein